MAALQSLDAQPYWDGLQAGRLLIHCCAACGRWRHYPRPLCPACQSPDHDWLPVSATGTVHSWAERDLATRSAWGTAGVYNVVDKMNLVY